MMTKVMGTTLIRSLFAVRCVKKMDHHCPWINICVGHDNHTPFIGFLFFLIVGCIHAVVINSTFLYRLFSYVSQLSLMFQRNCLIVILFVIFVWCYIVIYEPHSLMCPFQRMPGVRLSDSKAATCYQNLESVWSWGWFAFENVTNFHVQIFRRKLVLQAYNFWLTGQSLLLFVNNCSRRNVAFNCYSSFH